MPDLAHGQLGWLIQQIAVVVLSALALKLSVGIVSGRASGARNDLTRAVVVAAALHLFSIAVRTVASDLGVGALGAGVAMLVIWAVVVRWAYRLSLAQTALVAVVMLVIVWLSIAVLSIALGAAHSAFPWS